MISAWKISHPDRALDNLSVGETERRNGFGKYAPFVQHCARFLETRRAFVIKCVGFHIASSEFFRARQSVGYQVAKKFSIGQRVDLRLTGFQFRNAGILHFAIDQHCAFLAHIGIEARKTDRQIRLAVAT